MRSDSDWAAVRSGIPLRSLRLLAFATVFVPGTHFGQGVPPVLGKPVTPAAFAPGLSDVMTMLVQPRHIRLYEAGSAQNWELAAFELQELRSSLERVQTTIPRYQGVDVSEAVRSIMASKLSELSGAITSADEKRFEATYRALTEACNACHAYLEHPFLVITIPRTRSAAYVDQEFSRQAP